jgi:hypothetical protein
MKIYENGIYRELTPSEIAEMEKQAAQAEREYWQNVPYDEAVNAEIRKRYTESQEFAVLRQRDEKPEEYEAYYAYCEECKAFVKAKKQEVENDPEH